MDAGLFRWIYGWFSQSPLLPVMECLTHLGDSKTVFLIGSCGFAACWKKKRFPLWSWLGVPLAGLITGVMKEWIARPRPSVIHFPLGEHGAGYSFPSGHATAVFALAMLFILRWPKGGVVWFMSAGFVALSRVALGLHWPSDVVAGALIGMVVVGSLALLERKLLRR